MNLEFPYQLTAFLDSEPTLGEPVYNGENGWYPQIALKRRFKVNGLTEVDLLSKLDEYCRSAPSFSIHTGSLSKPNRMPVQVIEVDTSNELMSFHQNFISFIGDALASRYPERDGSNYLPHITAEFNGKMVIDDKKFTHRDIEISKVFLLKDVTDEDSIAYKSFDLR